ncbi:hypothetical protein CYMTET_54144 [Cymbomonas tetramitiformis]|uniref:BART domain-containing protein n=1 Tax=Cymbomonas tetramitiformis TaxID=36881 RepID=A0AAE0BHB1_9CHLO|nr:hypothetical protein CYMTET_54144 [Cymbomonas tetramitiformis]
MAEHYVAPPDESSQAFIVRLATFLGEESVEQAIESFLREKIPKGGFTTTAEGEHSLEAHAVYTEYLALVEGKLEGFLTREGLTSVQFQLKCQAAKEDDSSIDSYMDSLVASWDFEAFGKLCKDFQQELQQPTSEPQDSGEGDEYGSRNLQDEELFM